MRIMYQFEKNNTKSWYLLQDTKNGRYQPGRRRAESILSGRFVAAITVTLTLSCKPVKTDCLIRKGISPRECGAIGLSYVFKR